MNTHLIFVDTEELAGFLFNVVGLSGSDREENRWTSVFTLGETKLLVCANMRLEFCVAIEFLPAFRVVPLVGCNYQIANAWV